MKYKITKKQENALAKQVLVEGTFETDATTPSNTDVRKHIASQLKVPEARIVMRRISTKFGERSGSFHATVYEKEEDRKFFEMNTKHMKEQAKKAAEKEKKKAEEAKAAKEAPAEKPVEEKKEEEKAE